MPGERPEVRSVYVCLENIEVVLRSFCGEKLNSGHDFVETSSTLARREGVVGDRKLGFRDFVPIFRFKTTLTTIPMKFSS
jgi:hypothetical protein